MSRRASKAQRWALEVLDAWAKTRPLRGSPDCGPTAYVRERTWACLLTAGWIEFYGDPDRYGHRATRLTATGHAQLATETAP